MSMTKKEILSKVKKIEEKKEERNVFVRRCLYVKICPDCDSKVILSVNSTGTANYNCTSCSFNKCYIVFSA